MLTEAKHQRIVKQSRKLLKGGKGAPVLSIGHSTSEEMCSLGFHHKDVFETRPADESYWSKEGLKKDILLLHYESLFFFILGMVWAPIPNSSRRKLFAPAVTLEVSTPTAGASPPRTRKIVIIADANTTILR